MTHRNIIGYFHICQIGEWKRSFDLIMNYIKNYGLYDHTTEIRCGILNDSGVIIPDKRLECEKFKIIYVGNCNEYERPTLLHMKRTADSNADSPNTCYWYLHTKGLRHFNTPKESFVIDWIKVMLYWNIRRWRTAIEKLDHHDTYGCNNFLNVFYSGNFWWANNSHIKQLPGFIEEHYTAPEGWILKKKDNLCNIFSSGLEGEGHYNQNYPEHNYTSQEELARNLPNDFDAFVYRENSPDLQNLNYEQCATHFLDYGRNETRIYKNEDYVDEFPLDFDYQYYKNKYNDLSNFDEEQLKSHWINFGKFENRIYKDIELELPSDFDFHYYRTSYPDLHSLSDHDLKNHWNSCGKFENRLYRDVTKLPKDFDVLFYRLKNKDIGHMDDGSLIHHWLNSGRFEGRMYKEKMPPNFNFKFYRESNKDLANFNDKELEYHWLLHGRYEKRPYIDKLPDDFDFDYYRNNNNDLKNMTNKQLENHYLFNGKYEKRKYKMETKIDLKIDSKKKIETKNNIVINRK